MKRLTARHLAPSLAVIPLLLTGCGQASPDPRGVDRSETLLSVSATGHADARPDKAEFQAGIQTWARNARDASSANAKKISEIVGALGKLGIEEKDIQTRAVSVDRIERGDLRLRTRYRAGLAVASALRAWALKPTGIAGLRTSGQMENGSNSRQRMFRLSSGGGFNDVKKSNAEFGAKGAKPKGGQTGDWRFQESP